MSSWHGKYMVLKRSKVVHIVGEEQNDDYNNRATSLCGLAQWQQGSRSLHQRVQEIPTGKTICKRCQRHLQEDI